MSSRSREASQQIDSVPGLSDPGNERGKRKRVEREGGGGGGDRFVKISAAVP